MWEEGRAFATVPLPTYSKYSKSRRNQDLHYTYLGLGDTGEVAGRSIAFTVVPYGELPTWREDRDLMGAGEPNSSLHEVLPYQGPSERANNSG
jgi:hypothetical protein